MVSSYAADRALMERVADGIRVRADAIFLQQNPISVSVVDGDRAGFWLEMSAGPWFWTASDINGPWGVTTFAADRTMLVREHIDEFETADGRTVFWWSNREDGPTTTDVDEIVEWILSSM